MNKLDFFLSKVCGFIDIVLFFKILIFWKYVYGEFYYFLQGVDRFCFYYVGYYFGMDFYDILLVSKEKKLQLGILLIIELGEVVISFCGN